MSNRDPSLLVTVVIWLVVLMSGTGGACQEGTETPPAVPIAERAEPLDPVEVLSQQLQERGFRVRVSRGDVPAARPMEFRQLPTDLLLQTTAEKLLLDARAEHFAVVETAAYSATVSMGELREGRFECQVRKLGRFPAWLDWSVTSLAIHEVSAKYPESASDEGGQPALQPGVRQPVIWGTSPDLKTLIQITEPQTLLQGSWSVRSESSRDAGEGTSHQRYQLSFPPALQTQLELKVPKALKLTVSSGLVHGPSSIDDQWDLWRIDVGRRRDLQLQFSEQAAVPPSPRATGRIETVYSARQDSLQIQVDLSFEVNQSRISSLLIDLPEILEITGATLNNVPLPVERQQVRLGQASVVLGELPLDQTVILRLQAQLPIRWGRPFDLPQVAFPQVSVLEERVSLFVESPLLVRRASPRNLIQTGLAADNLGELWSYQALGPGQGLSIDIGLPSQNLDVQVDTVLALDIDRPAALTRLNLLSRTGQASRMELMIPSGWEVIDVFGEAPGQQVSTWGFRKNSSERILAVEFGRLISADRPGILHILLRGLPVGMEQSFELPILRPQTGGEVSGRFSWGTAAPVALEADPERSPARLLGQLDPPAELWGLLASVSDAATRPGLQFSTAAWRWPDAPLPPRAKLVSTAADEAFEMERRGVTGSETGRPQVAENSLSGTAVSQVNRLAAQLDLTTVLSSSGGTTHLQRALYRFTAPASISSLGLRLPAACGVSAVTLDGSPVTVLRQGAKITFSEAESACTELELLYVVPAEGGFIFRDIRLPVPEIAVTVNRFNWIIESAGDSSPVVLQPSDALHSAKQGDPLSWRLLGPLARSPDEPWFNPWTSSVWQFLTEPLPARPQSTVELRTLSIAPPAELQLRVWAREQVQAAGWLALFLCGLIGTAIRRWNWSWLRQASIPWVLLLVGLVIGLPPLPARIAGGAFVGTVLSLLIPRAVIRARDLLAARRRVPKFHTAAVIVICLTCCCTGVFAVQLVSEAEPPLLEEAEPDVVVSVDPAGASAMQVHPRFFPAGQNYPHIPYLLTGIKYELLAAEAAAPGIHFVRAVIDFQILDERVPPFMQLPFRRIVFRQGAVCLLDGVETPLIPAAEGESLLCPLAALQPGPRHTLEMVFGVREDSRGQFSASVPPVANATFQFSTLNSLQVVAHGQRDTVPAGDLLKHVVYLGNRDQIIWYPSDAPPPRSNATFTAQSLVTVSPLMGSATTVIAGTTTSLEPVTWPELLLPASVILRRISADQTVTWKSRYSDQGETIITLASPLPPGAQLRLEYEWPQSAGTNDQLQLPRLVTLRNTRLVHDVALATSPWFSLKEVRDSQDPGPLRRISPADRTGPLLTDPRVREVVQFDDGRQLSLSLARLSAAPRVRVQERLRIDRESAQLEAQLEVTPTALPQFLYALHLNGDWHIENLQLSQRGAVRNLRWQPYASTLLAFLPEVSEGPFTILLTATFPLTIDNWTAVPETTVIDSTLVERTLIVESRTNWKVEIETSSGTIVAPPGASNAPQELPFPAESPIIPRRLRIVPDRSAYRADSVSLLQRDEAGELSELRQYNIQALDAPLGTIRLRLAANLLPEIELLPADLQASTVSTENGMVELNLVAPARMRDDFRFAISLPVIVNADGSLLLPEVQVLSAAEVARLLIVPRQQELSLDRSGGRIVTGAALPRWTNPDWIEQVRQREADCYQLISATPRLTAQSIRPQAGIVPWLEHLVWIQDDGSFHGESRFWLSGQEAQRLQFEYAEGSELLSVSALSGRARLLEETPTAARLELQPVDGLTDVLISWRTRQTKSGPLTLPTSTPLSPQQTYLAVVHRQAWESSPGSGSAPLSSAEAILVRMGGYLNCLEAASGTLSTENSLLRQLRQIRSQAQSELSGTSAPRADWQLQFEALNLRWEQLQQELQLNANVPAPSAQPEPLLNDPSFAAENVSHFLTAEPRFELALSPRPVNRWWSQELASWGVVCLCGLLLMWLLRKFPIREWLANRPAWAGILLGLWWWSSLSHGIFGFGLLVLSMAALLFTRPATIQPAEQPATG